MNQIFYCLTCKKRVTKNEVIMEMADGHGYKHFLWYMQSGKQDYVLHPVRIMYEQTRTDEVIPDRSN